MVAQLARTSGISPGSAPLVQKVRSQVEANLRQFLADRGLFRIFKNPLGIPSIRL